MNKDLITWIAGIVVAIFSAVTFLFSNFQTSNAAQKFEDRLEQRLDKIESKIDALIGK